MRAALLSGPLYRLSLRSQFAGRRPLALAVLALIPVAAAIGSLGSEVEPEVFWARVCQRLVIPTIAAFVAVVVGVTAVGDEREDGTILYLAATPLRRATLMVTKLAGAWTASLALMLPSTIATGVIALRGEGDAGSLWWPLVGVALTCLCYCAASIWLSMLVRRPMVIGMLYILLWEGTIANFADSADRLSVAAYGRAIAVEGMQRINAPDVSAGTATVVLLVVTALLTWLATRRLTRTELP